MRLFSIDAEKAEAEGCEDVLAAMMTSGIINSYDAGHFADLPLMETRQTIVPCDKMHPGAAILHATGHVLTEVRIVSPWIAEEIR